MRLWWQHKKRDPFLRRKKPRRHFDTLNSVTNAKGGKWGNFAILTREEEKLIAGMISQRPGEGAKRIFHKVNLCLASVFGANGENSNSDDKVERKLQPRGISV